MGRTEETAQRVHLSVANIGGIDQTECSFTDGITILAGHNASNRTSLLRAIMAGLGSENSSLKGDAEEGHVSLQFDGTEHTRTLSRQGDTVRFDGDPYLDDPELADLFAFLLASNEARRAVSLQAELRDIVMRPVDSRAIQREIDELQAEKAAVEDRIEERESLARELSALRSERDEVSEELAAKRESLAAKRETLDAEHDGGTAEIATDQEESPLEAKLAQLQETRSELDTVEFRIESQREGLEQLRAELAELEAEQSALPADVTDELDEIEAEIDRLRTRKQELEGELSTLQSVIQFNEQMLDGNTAVAAALDDGETEAVTDQLLDGHQETVCWTCGTGVPASRIDDTLAQLREFRRSKFGEQTELDDRLSELKDRRETLRSRKQKHERLTADIEEIRTEIDERESKLTELSQRRDELQATLTDLDAEIDRLEAQEQSAELELRSEINRLELECDRLAEERDRIGADIAETEASVEEMETLEQQRATIQERISQLRTRIDRLERDVVGTFNEQMATVLDRLGYENLERIWLERVDEEVAEGRGQTTRTAFRLHVVRSADGTVYEDEFAHLSESEREVTGLVFALAGYLVHDVHETVPFLILDSLEAIDADRIARLVEYFSEFPQYLVVALLDEDAAALDDEYERLTEI